MAYKGGEYSLESWHVHWSKLDRTSTGITFLRGQSARILYRIHADVIPGANTDVLVRRVVQSPILTF